jgi:CBS domain-containing protein
MRVAPTKPTVVSDLMTTDLIALIPIDTVGRARQLLATGHFHALPVMQGNAVLGIVTTADLVSVGDDDELVTALMTPVPTAIPVDAPVDEAAALMLSERIHHLVVIDDREVVGILSSLDLLAAVSADQPDR